MDSSPTPFGRGRGQQRPPSSEPLTQFQALELKKDAVRIRKALLPAARNDAFTKLT